MRRVEKSLLVMMMLLVCMVFAMPISVDAKNKVKKRSMTIDLNMDGKSIYFSPINLYKYSKVKVSCGNKKVLSAKYVNHKEIGKSIHIKVKKPGKTNVIIKLYKKSKVAKTFRYTVKVIGKGQDGYKAVAKKAFKIQNSYRRAKGKKDLEWSEELYKFALYRLKTSGYDRHKNLDRDTDKYFGVFAGAYDISFGENLASGPSEAKKVMVLWKGSEGHYYNLLRAGYKCGAIAKYKEDWCAIFSEEDASKFKNWKDDGGKVKAVTVKRFDDSSNSYIADSSILYYEEGKKWDTSESKRIGKESGLIVYLEIGKTYVFTERVAPDGLDKAESVMITVTKDGPSEVILKN